MQIVLYAPILRAGIPLKLQKYFTKLSGLASSGLERCHNYERIIGHLQFHVIRGDVS
jgi:hypothetical protein